MVRNRISLRLTVAIVLGLSLSIGAQSAAGQDLLRAAIPAPAGKVNHGAAIAQMRSGALLACWYSGTTERNRDARILCARAVADGSDWSKPWTAVAPGERAIGAAAPNKSLGNVTLTATPDGRVWMIYGVIQSRRWPIVGETCANWACGRIDARVSDDEGRSWRPAHRLVDLPGALPRAELKAAKTPGLYWAPFYQETARRSLVALISLTGERARVRAIWGLSGFSLIQPALAPDGEGRLRAYFRDPLRRAVFTGLFDPKFQRLSGVARTNLPNPDAAVDVFRDGAGRYVLIYNPSTRSRDRLSLARSADGAYFRRGCALSLPGAETGTAYPSVIRGQDGAWLAVYSSADKARVVFVRFTSDWLDKCFIR